ncbi:MAG: hypothetical protein P8Y45_13720, partial [Exilibacterium sp.]
GIHASNSLGQLPPDVRLTLCLPRLIEKLPFSVFNPLFFYSFYYKGILYDNIYVFYVNLIN